MRRHLLSRLACLGSHSITGLLTTAGKQFADWTADYRLYAQRRVQPQDIFDTVRRQIANQRPEAPLVVAVDDTRTRHTGRKIPGLKYTRDPMGPPFHINFIRANRFLQISAAYSTDGDEARMIPIDLIHAPTPDKPRRKAGAQDHQRYRQFQEQARLPRRAADRLQQLRRSLDEDGHPDQALWIVGDGGFTNKHLLKNLPPRSLYIGRIRGDAKLYGLPEENPAGRKRVYGPALPTPEQIRQDPVIPWQKVSAFACGKNHTFHVKTIDSLRWRPSGSQNLRLLIIRPLQYRPSKSHRVLYRKAAFLICTDPQASIQKLLQAYLWRWDIEVNFRDEKSLLGIAEAKVRDPNSVETVPALGVCAYSLLLPAALQEDARGGLKQTLAPPRWRRKPGPRFSTSHLISLLRHELWHAALRKTHFVSAPCPTPTAIKQQPQLESALLYAIRSG